MEMTRRQAMLKSLFGAGMLGLRSLASGIPVAILANPRRALAAGTTCPAAAMNPQFLILSTSGNGDPVNANVPGTYLDPHIAHSSDPTMAPTSMSIGGKSYQAAAPWATLPTNVLSRTCFFHHSTNTVVHPQEPNVMELMGAIGTNDQLASVLSAYLQPCLGTIQAEPVSLGAASASEAVSFQGRPQPMLNPSALGTMLTSPAGPLANLQSMRDDDVNALNTFFRGQGIAAQQKFIDTYVNSQAQVRSISQSLLSTLASIKDNSPASQVIAAIALIQMKVTPVVTIHIPFGGDNHTDADLKTETTETVAGVATIVQLQQQLAAANLQDNVTFAMLNVFGRTLMGPASLNGRQHNGSHHCTVIIGKNVRGSVIGGVAPLNGDYGALPIDSQTGQGSTGGDISVLATLASLGKTVGAAAGADASYLGQAITGGQVVGPALASSS